MESVITRLMSRLPEVDKLSIPVLSETVWGGNSLLRWLIALGAVLGVALVARLVKGLVASRLERFAENTDTRLDDIWLEVLNATSWVGYLGLGLSVAMPIVDLTDKTDKYVSAGIFVLFAIQAALWFQAILRAGLQTWTSRQETAKSETAAAAITFLGRLLIWTVVVLVVLSNLGVEITTVVAGLGVGGVAAALAVQSILSDLFAGLSMYFDRPFDIGDFIIVGDVMGNVRKIGLRTTRIDSLGGEKIVYPNGELTKNFIRNYAWMKERRITFAFGIEYNVPPEKIERARDIAQQAIEEQSEVRFDRAHFKSYGSSSLDFEVVYYVLSPDYNLYMDKQHAINLSLYRSFTNEEIPFAFPTRTIYTRTEAARVEHEAEGEQ